MQKSKTQIFLALILAVGIAGIAPQSLAASTQTAPMQIAECLPEDCGPELADTDINKTSKEYKKNQRKIHKGIKKLAKKNKQLESLLKLIG